MHKTRVISLFILTSQKVGGMMDTERNSECRMYVNSGYLNNSRIDFKDTSRPLVVGSCGTYRLTKKPFLPTQRPRGRIDYQLLYIASGKVHFFFDGKETVVNSGNMVLYRPREPQKYIYYADEHPEVFWVHFTGSDVNNILDYYDFPIKENVIKTGISPDFKHIFTEMIQELQACRPKFEEVLPSLLNHLFILISRNLAENRANANTVHEDIVQAVHYFNQNYSKEIVIEKYAEEHNFRTDWFTRGFKHYTGVTPMQYILSLRMTNAQYLLEQTNSNVTEIANIVGYDNPLYFSRLFKKHFGVSPAQYRKNISQPELPHP